MKTIIDISLIHSSLAAVSVLDGDKITGIHLPDLFHLIIKDTKGTSVNGRD